MYVVHISKVRNSFNNAVFRSHRLELKLIVVGLPSCARRPSSDIRCGLTGTRSGICGAGGLETSVGNEKKEIIKPALGN